MSNGDLLPSCSDIIQLAMPEVTRIYPKSFRFRWEGVFVRTFTHVTPSTPYHMWADGAGIDLHTTHWWFRVTNCRIDFLCWFVFFSMFSSSSHRLVSSDCAHLSRSRKVVRLLGYIVVGILLWSAAGDYRYILICKRDGVSEFRMVMRRMCVLGSRRAIYMYVATWKVGHIF